MQDPPNTAEVGFAFDQIDWPGHVASFFAKPVNLQHIPGLSTFLSHGATRSFDSMEGVLTNSTTENVTASKIPGTFTFFLTGPDVVPKGFRMTLRTRNTSEQ